MGARIEPVLALGLLFMLRQATLAVGLRWHVVAALQAVPVLDRLARLGLLLCLFAVPLAALMQAAPPGGAFIGVASMVGRASVKVSRGRVTLTFEGPITLELPVETGQDERLAMVLCRLLRNRWGKPALSHQYIADAFGKKSRQDSYSRMQKLARADGSLAAMILQGQRGRPSKVHPAALAEIAHHWERNPLASVEETCQWLQQRGLPADVPMPTADAIRTTARISGNVQRMRNATKRLLQKGQGGISLRANVLFERLLEVTDRQAKLLHEAAARAVPLPAMVQQAVAELRDSPKRASKTGRKLLDTMRALTTSPSSEEDEQLTASIGAQNLSPLHFGVLYCLLQLSIGQVAALVGRSKSTVYRGLVALDRCLQELDPWPAAARFSGVLALDEKWLRIPKSFSAEEQQKGKKWRYAHFAVDALTGDLLHVEVFDKSDAASVRAFLVAVRALGIRPKWVVTDMLGSYSKAIADTFGPGTRHHYCLFHHLQAVRHRLREKCGKDWKKHRLLRRLVRRVDRIYNCRDRRTAKKRLREVLALRDELARQHPEAVSLLETLEERFPLVVNTLGRDDLPQTNNIVERTIRAFCSHYKNMAGLESVQTARIQLRLFRFFYRLTPMRETARRQDRGRCPLQRAGWQVSGVPIADYVRGFTVAFDEQGPALLASAGGHRVPISASRDPPASARPSPASPRPGPSAEPDMEHQPVLAA